MYDLIVVGLGASGMFLLSNLDSKINALGIESNSTAGKKLLLTGGGRCNLTNNIDIKEFIKGYSNTSFSRSIIYNFNNTHLINWFNSRGFRTSSEGEFVYPSTFKSSSVCDFFLDEISKNKHCIHFNETVLDVIFENDLIHLITTKSKYKTKNLVFATGGASFPKTGSNGKLVSKLFKINNFEPALCPLYLKEKIFNKISALSIKNVSLSYKKIKLNGSILITKQFLSGPVTFNLSNIIENNDSFSIDFLPSFSFEKIKSIMKNEFTSNPKKIVKNNLLSILNLPESLISSILEYSNFNKSDSSNLSNQEIDYLVENFKNLSLNVKSKGDLKNATASKGGIKVNTISNKNMSLLSDPRIFFIGETVDIVGFCGGYNLQFAFSSAMKVAKYFNKNI